MKNEGGIITLGITNYSAENNAVQEPQRSKTPEEKEFIMAKLDKSGLGSFNLFALTMFIRDEVKNVDLTHYRELAKEVSRIGVNINQIAKFANADGNIYPQEIAELQERMSEIWRLLKSSLSE